MAIYIIQCLCPNRHAIFAVTYDPADMPHDVAMATFQSTVEKLIAEKAIDPWCGICKSRDWTYEQRRTKYATMEEAKPEMMQLEWEQILTRAQIEQEKRNKN